jgi:hypothetical protein
MVPVPPLSASKDLPDHQEHLKLQDHQDLLKRREHPICQALSSLLKH